jgi:hypothetical protein
MCHEFRARPSSSVRPHCYPCDDSIFLSHQSPSELRRPPHRFSAETIAEYWYNLIDSGKVRRSRRELFSFHHCLLTRVGTERGRVASTSNKRSLVREARLRWFFINFFCYRPPQDFRPPLSPAVRLPQNYLLAQQLNSISDVKQLLCVRRVSACTAVRSFINQKGRRA